MIAALIVFGLIVAGLGVGFLLTATAPVGYQDETGFHFGQPHGGLRADRARRPARRGKFQPKLQPKTA